MKFGNTIKRILWKMLLANPEHKPVKVNKTGLSNGFYRGDLNPFNTPKPSVIFPIKPGRQKNGRHPSGAAD